MSSVPGRRIGLDVVPSIRRLPQGQWDALVGPDNFYNSYRWLRGLELTHGSEDIVAVSRGGTLLGALPTWPGEAGAKGLFSLPEMFPGLACRWPTNYLWLGARRSVYNELVCVRGRLRPPTLTRLVRGALRVARARGAAGLVAPYLAPDDARDLVRAEPRARILLHGADANMAIPAGGFEDQLRRMSRHSRARRRAELRALERSGTVVKWLRLTGDDLRIAADLVTQNRTRYGSTADINWMRRSFAAQQQSGVLDQAVGCFGIRDDRPLAVTICYTHHDRLYARYYGFDYRRFEPAGEYFVLGYCAPLDYGGAHGLRRYRLAVSAARLKAGRGATLSPLAAVVLPMDHEVCSPGHAADLNRDVVRQWRDRCAAKPRALDTQWDSWDAAEPTPILWTGGTRCSTLSTA